MWRISPRSSVCPVWWPSTAFVNDTDRELDLIRSKCKELGVNVALSEVWGRGGEGGIQLAQEVLRLCEQPKKFTYAYELDQPLKSKIEAVVKKIYGGVGVSYSAAASKELERLERMGMGGLPVCMAKTQYSLTDDQTKLGRPEGFYHYGVQGEGVRGRRLCGGPDWGYYDYARPAQGTLRGKDRRG